MADRPLTTETRKGFSNDPVLLGIVFAGVIALVFLLYSLMLHGEKRADVNKAQPNIETPATGETTKP